MGFIKKTIGALVLYTATLISLEASSLFIDNSKPITSQEQLEEVVTREATVLGVDPKKICPIFLRAENKYEVFAHCRDPAGKEHA